MGGSDLNKKHEHTPSFFFKPLGARRQRCSWDSDSCLPGGTTGEGPPGDVGEDEDEGAARAGSTTRRCS
jgi:hypothetical protein